MQYLTETQKISLDHIRTIKPYAANQFMLLDRATRRNLELCETMREKAKRGSLFWVLDKTKTAMGARLLRNSIEQPLVDPEEIDRRLDMVEELNENIEKSEKSENIKLGVSKKAIKQIELQKSKNKQPFNINNIDNYSLSDLKALRDRHCDGICKRKGK